MRERPEERKAREWMADALGVDVVRHEDGSERAMYDFKFEFPDGTLGAVEMTTISDEAAMQWDALTAQPRRIEGSRWAWMVHRSGRSISVKNLMRHLPRLTEIAEASGCTDMRLLQYGQHRGDSAVVWLRNTGITIHGFPETSNPGAVYLMPDERVDMVHDSIDPTLDWLETELARNPLRR